MSEREGWMPDNERLCMAFDLCDQAWDEIGDGEREPNDSWLDPLRAVVREAVEKALAEQKQQLERRHNEFWNALLTKQEARHKREVLEAKIDALDDLWVCVRRDIYGNAIECEWYNGVTPDSVRLKVARLASELAALDGKEKP